MSEKEMKEEIRPTPETDLAAMEFANLIVGYDPIPLGVSAAFAAKLERERDELLEQRDGLLKVLEDFTEKEFVENLEEWAEEFRQSQHGATLSILRTLTKIRVAIIAIAATKPEAVKGGELPYFTSLAASSSPHP